MHHPLWQLGRACLRLLLHGSFALLQPPSAYYPQDGRGFEASSVLGPFFGIGALADRGAEAGWAPAVVCNCDAALWTSAATAIGATSGTGLPLQAQLTEL